LNTKPIAVALGLLRAATLGAETPPVPGTHVVHAASPAPQYKDGRPAAAYRLDARDQGVVLKHGDGPQDCDLRGAREANVFRHQGTYYLHYDGAGRRGWLACLATSQDLAHWEKKGAVLDLGARGTMDSASASAPWVIRVGRWWHMFYMGTPNVTPAPDFVPAFPYLTLKARSRSPAGPWEKQYDVVPFTTKPDSYCSATASPGQVLKYRGQYLMFFSASTPSPGIKRTLSIARTKDLNGTWTVPPEPILPPEEQVENSSLYYEPKHKTWFLFTNHIGLNERNQEYTDAIWVYWSQDLERWDAQHKAVVLDGNNCTWSKRCIGMPSVVRVGRRLAVLYDAPGGESLSHMHRDIGLAWLELPLFPPVEP
jgi:predicted GH43/DUF377 family glycosyl hydrolase